MQSKDRQRSTSVATQSSRLAELGGLGMSFINICHGTVGSLAMFTAIRNASSRVSSFALDRRPASSSK
jgi:hypothetical protein